MLRLALCDDNPEFLAMLKELTTDDVSDDYYSIVHDAWSNTSVDCYQLWGSWNDFIYKIIP